jgi:hypothetical protein
MSDLNINRIKLLVVKDEFKLYPGGQEQWLSCDQQDMGTENILTANYIPPVDNNCVTGFDPEGTQAYDATNAPQTKCQKLLVAGRGLIYVDYADYTSNIGNCNACCVS